MIAIMIGVIITVRIRTRDEQPGAVELDRRTATDSLRACGDEVVADERDEHEDPDQAVDDRRAPRRAAARRARGRAAAAAARTRR